MLKVIYDAYDNYGRIREYGSIALFPESIDFSNNRRKFLREFIRQWKVYNVVLIYYTHYIHDIQATQELRKNIDTPSEGDIKRVLDIMEEDGMEKYQNTKK